MWGWWLAACATKHLVLLAPLTSPGARFDCRAADAATCTPIVDSDPARESVSDSAYVVLPAECRGAFDAVVVRHAAAARRDVWVTCGGATAACPVDGPCAPAAPSSRGLALGFPPDCGGRVNAVVLDGLHRLRRDDLVVCAPPDNAPGRTP